MDELREINKFTVILTIYSAFYFLFYFLFRIISLNVLNEEDYIQFSLILSNFQFIIQISTFQLHVPFTRQLRMNETNSYQIKYIFFLNYLILSFFGVFLFDMILYLLKIKINIYLMLWLSFNILIRTFIDYLVAIQRAKGNAYISGFVTYSYGIIQGLLVLSLFLFANIRFESILFIFGLGFFIDLCLGLIFNRIKIELGKIKEIRNQFHLAFENYKKSFYLIIQSIAFSFLLWILTLLASRNLDSSSYKLFDLSIMGITLLTSFGANIIISLLAKSKLSHPTKDEFLNHIKNYFLISLILSLIGIIVFNDLFISQMLEVLSLKSTNLGIKFFKLIPLFIIPIILYSYFNGKFQSLGNYKLSAKYSIISMVLSAIIIIIFNFLNSFLLCFVSLIFFFVFNSIFFFLHLFNTLFNKHSDESGSSNKTPL